MKRYGFYVKKYLYCFILAPFFMIMEACGEFILPYLNANIIDKGAANGDIAYIVRMGIYMLILALVMMAAGVLGAKFAIKGSAKLAAGIRKDTFDKIQTFSFRDIDEFSTGSLITRITNDITQIQNFTQTLMRGFFRSPIMLIGALVMSFTMNRRLSAILLVVTPLLGLAIFMIIKTTSPRYSVMQGKLDNLNTSIGESITNERVIKSFVREEYEKKRFAKVNLELKEKSIDALKMMMLMMPVSTTAINITTLLVVWFAGKQIMIGDMEIGTLTAFITYLTQVLMALNFLAAIILQGTRAAASSKRITEVLKRNSEISDDNATMKEHEIRTGDIQFKDVNFRYAKVNREYVLDNVSVDIKSGEIVGIVGSTGCGKTAFISVIPRLYDVNSGEVLIDGINVKELSLHNLRESVSVVLQKNTLFTGTIAENLRWGNENATEEEMVEASKIAQAHDFITSFENGYETEIEQGGMNLSGGQKQRICIARALLKKPKILILDDSTSAVDTATESKIRKAFREKLSGITKIIIAQRISSVIDADKIIVMDKGKVVGIGKHEELIVSCDAYKEIYYSQKDKEEA